LLKKTVYGLQWPVFRLVLPTKSLLCATGQKLPETPNFLRQIPNFVGASKFVVRIDGRRQEHGNTKMKGAINRAIDNKRKK